MTQEINKPDAVAAATPSPDMLAPDSNEFSGLDDAELSQLLGDAYDVPAVPRSLRKRLDRGVDELWGVSPGISESEPGAVAKLTGRAARALRAWPIAACLAAVVAVGVIFSGGNSFSWAAMVQALSEQPVVQMGSADSESGVRWMSVSEGVIGEQTDNVWRLVDFRRGVVLERTSGETHVRQLAVKGLTQGVTREHMVVAFLTAPDLGSADAFTRQNINVVTESWSETANGVDLSVTFRDDANTDNTMELLVSCDAVTQLPFACELTGTQLADVAVTYPTTNAADLVANAFPPEFPVVEVASLTPAAVANVADINQTNSLDPKPDAPAPVAPAPAPVTTQNVEPAPTLFGSATLPWAAIEPIEISESKAVAAIDETLVAFWKDADIAPVTPASEVELLRRVYLDLAGRTPSVNEVRDWVDDKSADKYPALVERLLTSRDHATHLATVWRTFLLPEGIDLSRFGGVESFDAWLSEQFEDNVPYDELVRKLMLAEGRLTKSGPLLFYTALKLDADLLAARTARVFLGMRLECAQCHDDPFEPWTQEDFWSYAAFFARISRPQAELETVSTVMRVRDVDRGEVMYPDSDEVVMPRFLDGSKYDDSPEGDARRHQLSKWLTSPENPFFARAAANRVWAHLTGRGIVDPVDGFGERNQPRSPELLNLLSSHFIQTDFDLRELFRAVALSRAYRLSSGAEAIDEERSDYFAQMNVKTLTAEQVYDCITVATMLVDTNGSAIERVGNMNREEFLQQFRTPGGNSTEYQGGIPQALTLMNGTLIGDATGLRSSGLLESLEAPFYTDDQRLEILYLASLSRPPSTTEWELLRGYISERDPGASVQEPLADILWALLNGAEFSMNH